MPLLCTAATATATPLHVHHPQNETLKIIRTTSHLFLPTTSLRPLHLPKTLVSFRTPYRRQHLSPVFSLTDETQGPVVQFVDIVEKDWSFIEFEDIGPDHAEKVRRIILAAEVGEKARVLVSFGSSAFVDRVVECSCDILLVIHDSLFSLAMIKEKYDQVRCWQGPIGEVPAKFSPFDVVFVCYFPGMGVSLGEMLRSLVGRCSPGARVVISSDQGRETIEQVHKQQYPDMVTSELPDRVTLEKAAAENSFHLTQFSDEPTFYLAVLKFCESNAT